MVSQCDKWVRIFDLYPENCIDAVTKVTVWKRFSDLQKLHKQLKLMHSKLKIKDKYPELPTKYFKRITKETVEERRQNILSFLEFIGSHSQLFMSDEFIHFFETGYTPVENLNNSNINKIRSDLKIPDDPEFFNNFSDNEIDDDEDDRTVSSDTDSLNTLSSTKTSSIITFSSNDVPQTNDFIFQLKLADQYEINGKYQEAFDTYKIAVGILILLGQEEKIYEKKLKLRYDTEKYLLKAERIYKMYLEHDSNNIIISNFNKDHLLSSKPIKDLYNYKVKKIIDHGLLVYHNELKMDFFMKIIEKPINYSKDDLILPENVPYMMKLHNYYDCENNIFIVLKYCRGKKLWDHLKTLNLSEDYKDNTEDKNSYISLIKEYRKINDNFDVDDDEQKTIDFDEYQRNFELPSINNVIKWSAQLLIALEKLHDLGITCKYIKFENIIIDENNDLKLMYKCNIINDNYLFERKSMTLAPEIYNHIDKVTSTIDWWYFGTFLYELLVGISFTHVHYDYFNNFDLKLPKYLPIEAQLLLKQLLVCDPSDRLGNNGTSSIKLHPFYRTINWNTLTLADTLL